MKPCFGVEMGQPNEEKNPGYYARLIKKAAALVQLIDRDRRLFIVKTKDEQNHLVQFYQEKQLFEESFDLIKLENEDRKSLFSDYGFISDSEMAYLYKDLIIAFYIREGNQEQKGMALLQMEELIIATENTNNLGLLYFVDRQQKILIEKIAHAYDITIEILTDRDLDKLSE